MPDAACWPLRVDAWRCLTLGCRCLTLPVRWHLFPLPPLAVNVRVGGKSSPPGKAPGSAPGSALWHGCELDDLSALISSVANDEQVVPLFASNNVKGEQGEGESEASAGQKMQG